jgi:hypothetical protein
VAATKGQSVSLVVLLFGMGSACGWNWAGSDTVLNSSSSHPPQMKRASRGMTTLLFAEYRFLSAVQEKNQPE